MRRIGILGDIGSGKSYIANSFGYPVFNADEEVAKVYKKDKKVFIKLKKILPKYIISYPVNKDEISNAILVNKNNLKKIIKIVHNVVRKKLSLFLKKNKNKKVVILDIPLLLENKIKLNGLIFIFISSKKTDILKKLKKRPNFNKKIYKIMKKHQFPLNYKKRRSHYIIKNNLLNKAFLRQVKYIKRELNLK